MRDKDDDDYDGLVLELINQWLIVKHIAESNAIALAEH